LIFGLTEVVWAQSSPVFKVYMEESGVYRVTYEDLVEAGWDGSDLESGLLGLSNLGNPVPIWVDDGGDGWFDAGDWIEFVGERLSSGKLFYHDYSKHNVYWLTVDGSVTDRMRSTRSDATVMFSPPSPLRRTIHLERDQLMIRIRESEIKGGDNSDLWFWAKLSQIDPKPKEIKLWLNSPATESDGRVNLRIGVRGLSYPNVRLVGDMAHHRLEVSLNGEHLASDEWSGRKSHVLEINDVELGRFNRGPNTLGVSVPARIAADGENTLVDVVMLNWVEADFPHSGLIGPEGQVDLRRTEASDDAEQAIGSAVQLKGKGQMRIYTPDGSRVEPFVVSAAFPGADTPVTVRFDPGPSERFFVASGELRAVNLVEIDSPSNLVDRANQTDYLMIAHRRLIDAIQPLATFHRENGLEVDVVDVEDVYDEFNHGIIDPTALRQFISHAYHQWARPAPRFVLLVGDASWDTKNTEVDDRNYANWVDLRTQQGERFGARKVQVYAEKSALNHRQLIPTWNFTSHQGHSASDNYFVAVDGDDHAPDLAIGRFPLVEPEEVAAVVHKTISYARQSRTDPWRRNSLWITNESDVFQRTSDFLAMFLAERGFSASKVYPSADEADNVHHQGTLQDQLNNGQLIVHFLGHGGRHIWRTGPPDYRKNHDLFTLDHVAALEPTQRLSFILSMTCYSGPFDHPNQDSIGEMFLRVPERGAVGVFAASWRNSPSRSFSEAILEELSVPGVPVGEALMRAKQGTKSRTLVETYNLLGDPAIPLALPTGRVQLTVEENGDETAVEGAVDAEGFNGEGVLEWVDANLQILHSEAVAVVESGFGVVVQGDHLEAIADAIGVRAWIADPTTNRDAMGWHGIEVKEPEDDEATGQTGPAPRRTAQRTNADLSNGGGK
jgi:hypothetical protein